MAGFKLEAVEEDAPPPAADAAISAALGLREAKVAAQEAQALRQTAAAHKLILVALGRLSERAVAGWSALFSLFGVASVGMLYYYVLENPSILQLVGIGMYSAFLLILEFLRRKL
jgi:hypothetical protein